MTTDDPPGRACATLEATHKLSTLHNWTTVTNGVIISNGQHNVTDPIKWNTNTFYRLRNP